MPWIRVGKCVYKRNEDGSKGELEGCSDSVEKARAYLRALYSHEGKMKNKSRKIVMIEPLEEEIPEEETQEVETTQGVVESEVEQESESKTEEIKDDKTVKEFLIENFEKIKTFIFPKSEESKTDTIKEQEMDKKISLIKSKSSGLMVFKDIGGTYHAIGIVTNKWRDRDINANPIKGGEVITEAAHKEYLSYLDEHPEDAPRLCAWHEKKTASKSKAEWWDYKDGFVFMAWPLEKKEAEGIMKAEESFGPLGMSHEFYTTQKDRDNGLIHQYRMTEATHLPLEHAANLFTDFAVARTEVKNMAKFTEGKRNYLTEIFGEETTANLEKETEDRAKALSEAGVESKEYEAINPQLKAFETIAEIMSAIRAEQKTLQESQNKVAESITALENRVKEVEKSDDEKIAATIKPKISDVMKMEPGQQGKEITPEEAIKIKPSTEMSWFKQSFNAIGK